MMNPKCDICRNSDLSTLIALAWNGKMAATAISGVLGGEPTAAAIIKHLKADADGSWSRAIEVEVKPLRQRVYDLQRTLVDELERRIAIAKDKARFETEVTGEPHDWSEYLDILNKDLQNAIGSIIKTQGLADKREATQASLAVGLYELMLGGADGKLMLAPKSLVGDDERTIEGSFTEVERDPEA